METKSKKQAPHEVQAHPAPSDGPLKTFRIDEVSVSIFARTRKVQGSEITFYSVSFSRSYKDKEGVRKYTHTFDADDLGALATLLQQASEFIIAQQYTA